MKKIKKTLYTLDINNYEPEITALTYPLMKRYADKIGADFFVIKDRKFPEFPVTYEKMQIYNLAQEMENDWNIFVDADCLIHPDLMDVTTHLNKDTVLHNMNDESSHRYKPDQYFLRDGRFIGSCNWFAVASDWCIDLWHPLDIPLEEAIKNINPIQGEENGGISKEHLIDDYALSRNIAKYGLKFKTLREILVAKGYQNPMFMMHMYNVSVQSKLDILNATLQQWGVKV